MEWIERLNQSVEYIENTLTEGFQVERAAQIACCSPFHFQRMFSYISGIPLSEYIRRRRMSLVAFELQNTESKVLELALKYGYESPTAFNRAFQSVHGISPSAARKKGITLKAYPKITFTISIKGDAEMNYRIIEKEAFQIAGVKKHYNLQNVEDGFAEVPVFWQETIASGMIPKILSLKMEEPFGLLGVSTCMNPNDFDYYIAVSTRDRALDGMESYVVPPSKWAVFQCVGGMPQAMQDLQKRIVTEWLPSSGYEYADAPDIEVYFEGDQSSPEYRCEVWLPVRCK